MLSVLAFFLLLLPGLAWWLWWGNRDKDPVEALAGILGVSVAATALLALLLYLLELPLNRFGLIIFIGEFLILLLVGFFRGQHGAFKKGRGWAVLLFGALVAWRLWQARGLALPAWVDSLHHVLIVRKIVEAGGLVGSLEPYLPGDFYYHYAFHAFSALFSALSGLQPAQAVLLLGQVLSAGVSLSVYALGKTLTKDWRPALLAALFAAFVTRMPGYYLTWGRYTMLTAGVLMPLSMAEALRLRRGTGDWRQKMGLAVLIGGTLLSHYLAALLLALFLFNLGLGWILESVRRKHWDWQAIFAISIPALAGFVAVLPWYLRALRYGAASFLPGVQIPRAAELLSGTSEAWTYLRYLLGPETGYILLVLALAGLIWAFAVPAWRPFAFWSAIVAALALPSGFRLSSFRNDYFGLILFAAITVLAAGFVVWGMDQVLKKSQRKRLVRGISLGLTAALLLVGGWQNRDVINTDTLIADEQDVLALDWINAHVPEDARFFVNTVPWGYETYRGADGGAWILPYTGRWSIAPTVFYPFGQDAQTSAEWRAWGERAGDIQSCSDDFWELLDEAKINYLYLREDKGRLHAADLQNCPELKQLYDYAGVSIWLVSKPES